jgi:hypothetical protein
MLLLIRFYMKETPRRRIKVTSSLNGISTDRRWCGEGGSDFSAAPTPLGQIFQDDVKTFPPTRIFSSSGYTK